jgi:hypothetical protein
VNPKGGERPGFKATLGCEGQKGRNLFFSQAAWPTNFLLFTKARSRILRQQGESSTWLTPPSKRPRRATTLWKCYAQRTAEHYEGEYSRSRWAAVPGPGRQHSDPPASGFGSGQPRGQLRRGRKTPAAAPVTFPSGTSGHQMVAGARSGARRCCSGVGYGRSARTSGVARGGSGLRHGEACLRRAAEVRRSSQVVLRELPGE